jgi:hypothetical protein
VPNPRGVVKKKPIISVTSLTVRPTLHQIQFEINSKLKRVILPFEKEIDDVESKSLPMVVLKGQKTESECPISTYILFRAIGEQR